ncbi:MAG: nuclear transport factor 2 family protein [Longimicrobiales bacterium]|nr:nuclear transport factor 2 family protein [Longimicrobiales bacterium]
MGLTALDRLEILDLVARYNLTTDSKDVDGYMDCWAEDVLFESPFGTFRTREKMRAFEAHHVETGAMGKRHLSLNVAIQEEDEAALVTSDLVVLEVAEAPHVVATGRYDRSRVIRTPGGWRFAHRRLELDGGFERYLAERGTAARPE